MGLSEMRVSLLGQEFKMGSILEMLGLICSLLVNYRWWQHWIDYVNQDQPNNATDVSSLLEHCNSVGSSMLKRPSGIDNSDLINDAASVDSNSGNGIHDTLLEGRDYVLLPQAVWDQFHSW